MSAYDMRISDWSSGVCSSDLRCRGRPARAGDARILVRGMAGVAQGAAPRHRALDDIHGHQLAPWRLVTGEAGLHVREIGVAALHAPASVGLLLQLLGEIGRASCREGVCQYV